MATEDIRTRANEFERTIGGVTVHGEAHSLSAWFVLALLFMMGYAFLHPGGRSSRPSNPSVRPAT